MPTDKRIDILIRARDRASKVMDRVARRATATAARIARIGAASALAAGAGAAGGVALLTKRSLEAMDATAKWSERLGIATEALAGLQYAGKLAGVQTNQLQTGLQRMTRRIAEAAQGTGEAQGALEELGLDARRLAAMSVDKQFARVADAMQQIGNQNDRVRLAFKLFDSEGVALVNMLREGSAGLARMRQEADKLGLTFSRIDAAQVEAANDAFARMKGMLTGIGNTIAPKAAALIEEIANKLTKMGTEGEGVQAKVDAAIRAAVRGAAAVADAWNYATIAVNTYRAAVMKQWALAGDLANRAARSGMLGVPGLLLSRIGDPENRVAHTVKGFSGAADSYAEDARAALNRNLGESLIAEYDAMMEKASKRAADRVAELERDANVATARNAMEGVKRWLNRWSGTRPAGDGGGGPAAAAARQAERVASMAGGVRGDLSRGITGRYRGLAERFAAGGRADPARKTADNTTAIAKFAERQARGIDALVELYRETGSVQGVSLDVAG